MSRTTPTQRTLALLKKRGWTAAVVEKWIPIPNSPAGGIRRDLFGGIDVIALNPEAGWTRRIHGIQCCAASGLAAHRDKLRAEPRMKLWIEAGGCLEIHAWRKVGARGKRKLWEPLIESVLVSDFTEQPA